MPYDRSDHRQGHGGEDDEGHRGEGNVLMRRGRRSEEHVRYAVLDTVRGMVPMSIAAHRHGRRGGGRRHRPVHCVGHTVQDGAQHERHDDRAAKRREESEPWK
ncbi:hypothetical protein JCM4814A_81320 [Streptomyces phaeofaciens JCM 4814]|uniref:Uncharacterized protein n=1 Tax=Streptomyces phaeofaciens TaxID=68254 RepID=A0A918HPE3_9ACTN|nr:hypothetical protein GCM10010226_79350 [Streptomyces phaeofaciens]